MANNYTQFSTLLSYETDDQRDYLLNEFENTPYEDFPVEEGEEVPMLHICDVIDNPEDKHLWLSEWESGDLEALAALVCKFQKKFNIQTHFELEWADICSKLRIGEFCGGALLCYKGKDYWMNTSNWLYKQKKRLKISK